MLENRESSSNSAVFIDHSFQSDDLTASASNSLGLNIQRCVDEHTLGARQASLSPTLSFTSGASTSEVDEWRDSDDDVDPYIAGKEAETSKVKVGQRHVESQIFTFVTIVSRRATYALKLAPTLALTFFLGFAAFWFLDAGNRRPPDIQLASIAKATSRHVPLALDVVYDLIEVQRAIHHGFQIHQLQFLSERVAADRPQKSLETAIGNVHALSTDVIQPRVEIATTFWRLTGSIKTTRQYLEAISAARKEGRKDLWTEARLRRLVRDDLSTIPISELQGLVTKLSITVSRCDEVISSHESFALVHPYVQLIWGDGEEGTPNRWGWFERGARRPLQMTAAELEMQELRKAADGARQQFERAREVRETAIKAKGSVERYLAHYDGGELSILDGDRGGHNEVEEGASFEDFFVAVEEQMRELRSLTSEIHRSVLSLYRVWRDTTGEDM